MKIHIVALAAAALVAAACSGVTRVPETPELGVSTSSAPTQPGPATPIVIEVTQPAATAPPKPTKEPKPTEPPPSPTVGLPEGAILLPTQPRPGATLPPNTPVPAFAPGVLEATVAAQPPSVPQVAIYNAVFQRYQGGAMLYIAEMRQIWVMVQTPGKTGGPYYRFDDLFVDGDAEEIPDLQVPSGLLQPHRGFGRIWREQPGLRSQLGWAADFEIPFSLHAAHVASGAFDGSGNFLPGATLWIMTLHDNNLAYFDEASNTWAMGSLQ